MKKENSLVTPDDIIMSKIYLMRGQKVMLDRDLAKLYGVTTGNLNKAVLRNKNRFPVDFMFRLDDGEFQALFFQNGITKRGGSKVPPLSLRGEPRCGQQNVIIAKSFLKKLYLYST